MSLTTPNTSALPNNVWMSRNFTPSFERRNNTGHFSWEHKCAQKETQEKAGLQASSLTCDLEILWERWREKQFHLWNYTPLFSFILISTFKEPKKKRGRNIASIRVIETVLLQSQFKVNLDVQRCIWFLLWGQIGHFEKVGGGEKKKKAWKKTSGIKCI